MVEAVPPIPLLPPLVRNLENRLRFCLERAAVWVEGWAWAKGAGWAVALTVGGRGGAEGLAVAGEAPAWVALAACSASEGRTEGPAT